MWSPRGGHLNAELGPFTKGPAWAGGVKGQKVLSPQWEAGAVLWGGDLGVRWGRNDTSGPWVLVGLEL